MTDLMLMQRHEMLTRLLHLSRDQGDALESDRFDLFMRLMEERVQLVSELMAASTQPAPENVVAFPAANWPGKVRDLHEATRGLISCILLQDEENERQLHLRMATVRVALAQIGHGFATARGYASALRGAPEHRLLDVAY
ncbi:MAG TPA: hypothetical protein VFD32_10915 [Dehalococcoidia bacterium]|nr:hypothetical protein [Dehalococcoidia bacterium]